MHFKIMEWFTVTYHHNVNPSYKAKSSKENQCIVAWGHETSQFGGNVEPQKDHILFTFHIPFVTLFLSYPSIKPLIFTTFIINMGFTIFQIFYFLVLWVNLWLINEKNNIFSLYFKVGWVWWCLHVYLKTLTSSKVTTYPQIRILSSICGLISRRRSCRCGENISSNICSEFEGMSCRFVEDFEG